MRNTLLFLALLLTATSAAPLTPYNQGYDQGRQAGRREGQERGRHEGGIDGEHEGYQIGYQQAVDALLSQARLEGYQQGSTVGGRVGTDEGVADGLRQGREEGLREGATAGQHSADASALKEVEPSARAAGVKRAEASSPRADGDRNGKQEGLKIARETARKEDYERGRDEYRGERFAEPVKQSLNQRQSQLSLQLTPLLLSHDSSLLFGRRPRPSCDFRYLQYPSDNEEFQKGFRRGYESGFNDGYDSQYNWQYDIEFKRALSWGASQAHPGNLNSVRNEGYQEGYQEAYQSAYQTAQIQAKSQAYATHFQQAFAESYSKHYPEYKQLHFEKIESQTFENLYRPAYQSAFDAAEAASFKGNIEAERKKAYQRGIADEKADFEKRPLRVLEAWVTPTDVTGISLLTVKLRNFSDQAIAGHRVHLFWNAQTSRLYHAVPARSEVVVTGVFKTMGSELVDRDLEATLRQDEKDLFLGKVSVWPSSPK